MPVLIQLRYFKQIEKSFMERIVDLLFKIWFLYDKGALIFLILKTIIGHIS